MGRRWKLLAIIIGSLSLIGLGVFFVVLGLDQADKLASVLGFFVGLVGLGLSIAGLRRAQPVESQAPATPTSDTTSPTDDVRPAPPPRPSRFRRRFGDDSSHPTGLYYPADVDPRVPGGPTTSNSLAVTRHPPNQLERGA
nr:hypothetical protein GCM10017745_35750 [Saccharothrix mutabilis subsp. capreolus]